MGNNVVIPSFGNWYMETLKRMKIKVKSTIESSTFFITLDCVNENNEPLIVKAYEYTKNLRLFPIVQYSEKYFQTLDQSEDFSICGFNPIKIIDKCAYLVRPKFEYTLSQRLSDYPLPEEIEKKWISYELLTAVKSFHEAGVIHGNLHPDNVFLSWDLRLTIGDPAPYKPAQILFSHPQTFIHFFGSSNTHCYLSPRRLIIKGDEPKLKEFKDLDETDDIFPVGCIIYFIFTQKHLFTLSTIRDYVEGRYSKQIDNCLHELPTEIRDLVKKCIDLDPKQRKLTFENINSYFPKYFFQFFSQIQEFFENHITLSNLVKMIPILEEFANIGGDDVRIIWTNILAQFLLKSDDLHSKVNFSYFFINFFSPLSDEMVLTRVLPNLIGLLTTDSTLMTTTVFNCLEILFDNVKTVPSYLKLIFRNYLIPALSNLYTTSSVDIKCAIWDFVPRLLRITGRLDPECAPSFIKIYSLLFQPTDKIILDCFYNSFSALIREKKLPFLNIYTQLISCLNSPNHMLRVYIINIFMKYWDYIDSSEKKKYRKAINDILPVTFLLSDGEYRNTILDFVKWIVCTGVIDKYYYSDVFVFIIPFFNSSEDSTRYIITQIIKNLPEEFSMANLPRFILKSLNRREILSPKKILNYEPMAPSANCTNLTTHSKLIARTKFLASKRISTSPITSVIPFFNYDGFKAAASDIEGRLYKFSSQGNTYNQIYTNENKIKTAITLNSKNVSLIAEPNRILTVDWDPIKLTPLPYQIDSSIRSINRIFNDNCFFTTNEDSSVTFYDRRMRDSINRAKFNDLSMISSCVWPTSQTVGFGFDEGFVTLFDTRVFIPLQTFPTVQAKTISPIYDENGAFFVGGYRGSQVFNFTDRKSIVKLPFKSQISIPYKGSTIFFSQDSTFLVKMKPYIQAYVLSDLGGVQALKRKEDEIEFVKSYKNNQDTKIDNNDNKESEDDNNIDADDVDENDNKADSPLYVHQDIRFSSHFASKPPLHNHSVPITSVTELEYGFASGDAIGNVNFWRIE